MIRILLLLFLLSSTSWSQTPLFIDPVDSTQDDDIFDNAGEVSEILDITKRSGSPAAPLAVQAFAVGESVCTYSVKGSLKKKEDSPSGTDFVALTDPTTLSCLTTNDERLHFIANRAVQTIIITLESFTGTSVSFKLYGK